MNICKSHIVLNKKSVEKLKIAIFGSSGGGGGQSYLLTFYSDDLSLNPTEAYNFSCKI